VAGEVLAASMTAAESADGLDQSDPTLGLTFGVVRA
jgi:hypothetical protein